jgi:hypothetical protein
MTPSRRRFFRSALSAALAALCALRPAAQSAPAPDAAEPTPEAVAASLTPMLPADAASPEQLKALIGKLTAPELKGRVSGESEAAVEKIVREIWPQAERQDVRMSYRDVSKFELRIESSGGLSTPTVFPFYFSGMPADSSGLKLKTILFLGAGEEKDFPDPDRAASSLGMVALPEKMKPAEAQAKVLALIKLAEAKGLAALCIAGNSEFTDFDFGLIATSSHLPPEAENELNAPLALKRYAGPAQYLAARQVQNPQPERKLIVFYSPLSSFVAYNDHPREKHAPVRLSNIVIQGAAGNKALTTANFLLKVAGSDAARKNQWIQMATEWDGRGPGADGKARPGASTAASAAGLLLLGQYFQQHPAPRPMVFSLLGGGGWGGAGAQEMLARWPAGDSLIWNLVIPALGRLEQNGAEGKPESQPVLYLAGWSRSKSIQERWKSITGDPVTKTPGPFTAILEQYELKGQWVGDVKLDRTLTELTGLYNVELKNRKGTPLLLLGAEAGLINQPADTPDRIDFSLLGRQVMACGHFAQKLASPA